MSLKPIRLYESSIQDDSVMADVFDKQKRSQIMAQVRAKDTKPEMVVRRALHSAGFRFRLHCRQLPGTPDIVMRKYRTIVQVRGCFWHGHSCDAGRLPSSNRGYWEKKILRNIERDRRNDRLLRSMGWHVFVVWECRLSNQSKRETALRALLNRIHRL